MRTVKSDDFKVNVRGIKIDRCFATKYLGVLLDENLSWKPHITYLQKKLSQSVGIIAKMREYLDNTNLLPLYYSFFFSHILYGILGWGSATKSAIRPLQTLQNKVLKIISLHGRTILITTSSSISFRY